MVVCRLPICCRRAGLCRYRDRTGRGREPVGGFNHRRKRRWGKPPSSATRRALRRKIQSKQKSTRNPKFCLPIRSRPWKPRHWRTSRPRLSLMFKSPTRPPRLRRRSSPRLNPRRPLVRNAALPRNDLPSSDLPHIDASFRFNILPVKDGDVLTKWNRVKTDMRAENEVFARCRANMDSCPAAAKNFLDHRRPGPRADRARPHRRDQSRDQHGDRADERHGAMGRARQVERAARDVHDAQGRLRGLCHRQICRADRSRHCRRRCETHDRAQYRRA